MGVFGLWEILLDAKVLKNKDDLRGEIVAVDLATWICEAENVKLMQHTVEKPYLKNLLFRVITLSQLGIKLVFVADGKPPQLKNDTIMKRLDARNESRKCHSSVVTRIKLNSKMQKCCTLLQNLGIPWLKSEGEAEATCAALNMAGYVDACVTTDSDAFLYGATKLYRNLNIEKGVPCECYEISEINRKLKLNRDDLISLGLLLGCDYFKSGVPGIGKVSALNWLTSLKANESSLERLRKLKDERIENITATKLIHCSFCKHVGLKKEHTNRGCGVCNEACRNNRLTSQSCNCEWHVQRNYSKTREIEMKMIKHAKSISEFPCEALIGEFYKKLSIDQPPPQKCPNLRESCRSLSSALNWRLQYCVQKVLPLLTYWILNNQNEPNTQVKPIKILKTCKRNKVSMYEVEWELLEISDCDNQTTIEPQNLVSSKFPQLVRDFETKEKEKKEKKKALQKQSRRPKTTACKSKMSDFFKQKKSLNESVESSKSSDNILSSFSQLTISEADDEKTQEVSSNTVLRPLCDNLTDTSAIFNRFKTNDTDLSSSVIIVEDRVVSEVSRDMFDYASDSSESSSEIENRVPSKDFNRDNSEPSSPVFMSLAERIRLNSDVIDLT